MSGAYPDNETAEITQQEEAQLRRVHRLLCDYGAKKTVLKELRPKQDSLEKLRSSNDETDLFVASEIQSLETDVEKLRQDLQDIERKSDGLVSSVDLLEALKTLGRKAVKKDAESMIWEVDEDLDGCVSWDELRLMFSRNVRDKTGLEPSQLFNVVMFLIFDLDEDGMVSVDETMELLFARYGRAKMEGRLKMLFGDDMKEEGPGGGEIVFSTYLRAVEKTQLSTFLQSSHGKALVFKMQGNPERVVGKALMDDIMKADPALGAKLMAGAPNQASHRK